MGIKERCEMCLGSGCDRCGGKGFLWSLRYLDRMERLEMRKRGAIALRRMYEQSSKRLADVR